MLGEVRVGETLIMGVAGWLEGLAGPALVQFLGNEDGCISALCSMESHKVVTQFSKV